jgi:outer membrane biosynthesis protein TonB
VADQLISGSGETRSSAQPAAMAIVHTRDPEMRGGSGRPPRLVDCYRAELQRPVQVGKEQFVLGQVRGGDGATLFFREHWRGVVCLGGHERPLANLLNSARQVRKGVRKLELNVGDWAQLETDRGDTFHVRVFRPPALPKDPRELVLSRSGGFILGGSTTLHAIMMLVVSFLAGGDPVRSDAEVFAEVKMEDLDLKLPETAAPATAAPETAAPETAAPKPEPAVLSPAPDVPTPKDHHKSKSKAPPAATSADVPDDAPVKSGAVAALEALKTSDDGRADIRKAVTNLTLVKGPAGMSSPFKTSAAMEKLPGGSLRMTGGSGKGAGVLVRTGGESVDGTLGGHGTAIKGAKTSKGVGGLVVSASAAKATVSGSMDRAEILKVVNAHLAEIRRCYQKAVISGTASSGKAVFEWTIKGPGSVAGVRVKVSSLKNVTVESCIMDSIKKWKFPAVKGGGSVVVSFPFVFSATDF